MTTENTVKKIISEHLGVSINETKSDSHLVEDLGADSLDTVELIMAVEDEFGINIPDNEEWKLLTVQQIVDYVEEKK